MKLHLETIPSDLRPIALIINRLHAMHELVLSRGRKQDLAPVQQSIGASFLELKATFPESAPILDSIKLNLENPLVVPWMKYANDLRGLLERTLKHREAMGTWCRPEVDLRIHQSDGKPVG